MVTAREKIAPWLGDHFTAESIALTVEAPGKPRNALTEGGILGAPPSMTTIVLLAMTPTHPLWGDAMRMAWTLESRARNHKQELAVLYRCHFTLVARGDDSLVLASLSFSL